MPSDKQLIHVSVKQQNGLSRKGLTIDFTIKCIKSLKFKHVPYNERAVLMLFLLFQVDWDKQTDSKAELVFVSSYLVSGDVCWIICDKRITGLLAASPAVDTHLLFFLSQMSNCKLSHAWINCQVLPLSHSPTFYSHIKCPEEHTSHGFIPLCVQPKSQSNWSQLSTQRRNISSFMES